MAATPFDSCVGARVVTQPAQAIYCGAAKQMHAGLPSSLALGAALEPILLGLVSYRPLATRDKPRARLGRYGRPRVKSTLWPLDKTAESRAARDSRA